MSARVIRNGSREERETMRFFYAGREVKRPEFVKLAQWFGKGRVTASRVNGATIMRLS